MTTVDVPTLPTNAAEIMKETMITDLHEILDEIEMTPDSIFERMGTTKIDMLKAANETLKAVEGLK